MTGPAAREELAVLIDRVSKDFPLGTDLPAGCLGIADAVLEWYRKRMDASGTQCDLCEEVVTEWVWVDKGWSLACIPCLRLAANVLAAHEGKTTNLVVSPPEAHP